MFNDYYNEGIISQAISDHFQEAEIIKFEIKVFEPIWFFEALANKS